jgi:glycerophosphoryl diester phosphodiesterase
MSRLSTLVRTLGRPAVIAHRGASQRAPENSLAALRLAAELGADGVEFDVQASADGQLVVFHDRSLARCTGTVGRLDEWTLAQLRDLTLDAVDPEARGERIPTLDEWLSAAPPGLFLNLEVKVDLLWESHAARACVEALARAGRAGDSIVSSFHPAALAVSAATRPSQPRGALVDDGPGWRTRLGLGLFTVPQAVHPQNTLVTAGRMSAWKRMGLDVAVWTVDDPDEAARCYDLGVDAVITNVPDVIRPVAERRRRA